MTEYDGASLVINLLWLCEGTCQGTFDKHGSWLVWEGDNLLIPGFCPSLKLYRLSPSPHPKKALSSTILFENKCLVLRGKIMGESQGIFPVQFSTSSPHSLTGWRNKCFHSLFFLRHAPSDTFNDLMQVRNTHHLTPHLC